MREAFEKADNVLATAAKCITDVINSTGQINVDFADVCTVMRNGGVAILGNAEAAGENRAQRAIEEALNSPLLNDNDIRGAKWILINITSATGEHEFTMDEVEVIQQYILSQAGENSDVILGMGYDSNLGNKLGITLIATGFEHKDPFGPAIPKKKEKPEEKIVMVLGTEPEVKAPPVANHESPAVAEKEMDVMEESLKHEGDPDSYQDWLAPKLVDEMQIIEAPVIDISDMKDEEPAIVHFELQQEEEKLLSNTTVKPVGTTTVSKMSTVEKTESINSIPVIKETDAEPIFSGGYLARPSNIYAEAKAEEITSKPSAEKPVSSPKAASEEEEDLLDLQMQLVERDDIPAADMPLAHQAHAFNFLSHPFC